MYKIKLQLLLYYESPYISYGNEFIFIRKSVLSLKVNCVGGWVGGGNIVGL